MLVYCSSRSKKGAQGPRHSAIGNVMPLVVQSGTATQKRNSMANFDPAWFGYGALMVLLAATCSLQSFRFGKVQRMALVGLGSGFVFFLFREVSHNMGKSGFAAPEVAAWAPAAIGALLATSILLHREDG